MNEIQVKIKKAIDYIQTNPLLDAVATGLLKEIPIVGDILANIWDKAGGKADQSALILQLLKKIYDQNEVVSKKIDATHDETIKIIKDMNKEQIDIFLRELGQVKDNVERIADVLIPFRLTSLFFIMSCDSAIQRIFSLACNCKAGQIRQDNRGYLSPDPKKPQNGRYLTETMYDLLAPIANTRILMRRSITTNYVEANQDISIQYSVAKILYPTLTEAQSIANSNPQIEYSYNRQKIKENPAKYSLQGIFRSTLDIIIDGLAEDESVLSYNKFYERFRDVWRKPLPRIGERRQVDMNEALRRFSTILKHFHPKRKPVLWRIILAQLVLYQALERMQKDRNFTGNDLKSYLDSLKKDKQIREKIDWRQTGENVSDKEVFDDPLEAVVNYLKSKLERELRTYPKSSID